MNLQSIFSFRTPDRIMDKSLLTFSLPDLLKKIKLEKAWKTSSKNAITLSKNPSMKVVLVALHDRAELNFHGSGNIISAQIIEGSLLFKTDKHTTVLKKGSLLTCHECMSHTLLAIEESAVLLTILATSGDQDFMGL